MEGCVRFRPLRWGRGWAANFYFFPREWEDLKGLAAEEWTPLQHFLFFVTSRTIQTRSYMVWLSPKSQTDSRFHSWHCLKILLHK